MNNYFQNFNHLKSLTQNIPFSALQKSMGIAKISSTLPPPSVLKTICELANVVNPLPIKELQSSIGISQHFLSSATCQHQVCKNLGFHAEWLESFPFKELKKNLQPVISSLFSQDFSPNFQHDFKLAENILTQILKDNINDDFQEEDIELAVQEPSVQTVVSTLNASTDSPDQTMSYIVETLKQIQNTQKEQNKRLDAIEKMTTPKPLAVRVIIWILLLVLSCGFTPVINEYIVKPSAQAITQAKNEMIEKAKNLDIKFDEFIAKYKFVCTDSIILHQSRKLSSKPVVRLNFKSVVMVLEKYRKWYQVAYFSAEDQYFIGWIQNYKLEDFY